MESHIELWRCPMQNSTYKAGAFFFKLPFASMLLPFVCQTEAKRSCSNPALTVQQALPRSAILTGNSVHISLTGSGWGLLSALGPVDTENSPWVVWITSEHTCRHTSQTQKTILTWKQSHRWQQPICEQAQSIFRLWFLQTCVTRELKVQN